MTSKILISGKLHPDAIAGIEALPSVNMVYKPDCSRQELEEQIADTQVLITRSETTIDKSLLDQAPQLKVIVRAAVGVGNIDLNGATDRGILVINTPGKNTNSAAELTMGLLLALMRKIPSAEYNLKKGGWDRHKFSGYELRKKTLGIVGLGNVGHRVAQFCRGFDMDVWAYDPYISADVFRRYHVKSCSSLEELVKKSDILTVHVPLNSETRGMIDAKLLASMRPHSYVVNAARGGVVAEKDLLAALETGKIAGAAIDTFENEPHPLKELVNHPHVCCTPHIGASTEEAQLAIGLTVVDQVKKCLQGGVVDYPVNLPELGVIEKPVLKAYAVLCEKLGSLMGQLISFSPDSVTLHYRGDIAELDNSILRLSWMKGFVAQKVDDYISFVNVASHIETMGIKVTEAQDPQFSSYKSAVKVVIDNGTEELTVGGVVFDERYIRISLINDFYFEVEPSGHMILVENQDEPGVIGHVGSELARQGINISAFSLSRNQKGGKAMSCVCVDSPLTNDGIAKLKGIKYITNVHFVTL